MGAREELVVLRAGLHAFGDMDPAGNWNRPRVQEESSREAAKHAKNAKRAKNAKNAKRAKKDERHAGEFERSEKSFGGFPELGSELRCAVKSVTAP